MSNQHNAGPTDVASNEEVQFWHNELSRFVARDGCTKGVPKEVLPPPDALEYVLGKYAEELNIRNSYHDPFYPQFNDLHPSYRWGATVACIAHFLWFATPPGAKWLMGLYGVQEVDPFGEGYAYFWNRSGGEIVNLITPNSGPIYNEINGNRALVGGLELKIYRRWESDGEAACADANVVQRMHELLDMVARPSVGSNSAVLASESLVWVSEMIRDWLLDDDVDYDWPYRKQGRISGPQWIGSRTRPDGRLFYEALEKIGDNEERVYQIREPYNPPMRNGGSTWCTGEEIRIVPIADLDKMQGLMSESSIEKKYRCVSCKAFRTCVPYVNPQMNEGHSRCCRCYAEEMERNDRPTLDKCSMSRECKHCPSMIDSNSKLTQIKTKLNSKPKTPVKR